MVDELELRLAANRNIALETSLREAAEEQATILQEALLPPSLPTVDGLEFASRYRAEEGRVGGDFYDVVPTTRGAAVMVGDVCGKGARAASFTATARWSMRTILQDNDPPGRHVGPAQHRAHPQPGPAEPTARDHYCTVALARRRGAAVTGSTCGPRSAATRRSSCCVATARSTASARAARSSAGCPDFGYTDNMTRLQPGDVLVLYTDGLLDAVCGRERDLRRRPRDGASVGSPAAPPSRSRCARRWRPTAAASPTTWRSSCCAPSTARDVDPGTVGRTRRDRRRTRDDRGPPRAGGPSASPWSAISTWSSRRTLVDDVVDVLRDARPDRLVLDLRRRAVPRLLGAARAVALCARRRGPRRAAHPRRGPGPVTMLLDTAGVRDWFSYE